MIHVPRVLLASIAAAVLSLPMIPLPPPGPAPTRPTPAPTLPAIVVMSVGDSLTVGVDGSPSASYRGELSRLMLATGQPHTWVVAARGGSKCSEWAGQIDALITLHHPDIIFLNCGTNDTPSDSTEQDYGRILATAQARGVQVVASLIGRPDMESPTNTVRPYIEDWMDATNDAIRRAVAAFPGTPVAPMVRVPANPEWLQPDGIHLTGWAEVAWGQLFYQAAQPVRPGWRSLAQMRMAEMCGLSGHDRDDPWPAVDVDYRPCRN